MAADVLTVMIIAGGLAHEREISLRSGRRIATALKHRGHNVHVTDLQPGLFEKIDDINPDVVWPVVHGVEGEGGSLQDLMRLADVSYVGTEPEGCRISLAKPVAKSVVAKNDLRTPQSVALPQQVFQMLGVECILDAIEQRFSFPVMVKPSIGGSALGVTKVAGKDDLRHAMVNAFAYCPEVLIESFVPGREIAASIIDDGEGPRVLPLVEIRTDAGSYDYDARYNSGRSEFFCPADLSPDEEQALSTLALDCHRVLELRDLSRIDMILDDKGVAWFIDANVMPGMTDTSLFPLAAKTDGDFETIIESITTIAAER